MPEKGPEKPTKAEGLSGKSEEFLGTPDKIQLRRWTGLFRQLFVAKT
jgi:hypothetical protein